MVCVSYSYFPNFQHQNILLVIECLCHQAAASHVRKGGPLKKNKGTRPTCGRLGKGGEKLLHVKAQLTYFMSILNH